MKRIYYHIKAFILIISRWKEFKSAIKSLEDSPKISISQIPKYKHCQKRIDELMKAFKEK